MVGRLVSISGVYFWRFVIHCVAEMCLGVVFPKKKGCFGVSFFFQMRLFHLAEVRWVLMWVYTRVGIHAK